MKIKVIIKSVYGKDTIYPACGMSIGFAKLLRQTTLTLDNIRQIKLMGFEIEQVFESKEI